MDKNWKLERYSRKDYSEVVDFPVEIVGRDGVVRRYSFEHSIRLYQRRITFAAIRYRDSDLVQAEMDHCGSRIDQLRRSYFHRFGWGTPEDGDDPLQTYGDLAGEIAAFMCRVLRCVGRPEVTIDTVDSGAGDGPTTLYVVPDGGTAGMLLYVHRFEGETADVSRERFFASLKMFERLNSGDGDGERLVAFHHTIDCGFILSARGTEFDNLGGWNHEDDEAEISLTPWDEVMKSIRQGAHEKALSICTEVVTDQPWHRNAYVAGAVLSTFLKRPLAAEDFALVGSRYFPGDAVLQYQLGVARRGQARNEDASKALQRCLAIEPGMVAARFLAILIAIEYARWSQVRQLLSAGRLVEPDDCKANDTLARLGLWMNWRDALVYGGGIGVLLGFMALATGTWAGLLPVLVGATTVSTGLVGFRLQVRRLQERQRFDEVSEGLRRLNRPPTSNKGDVQ